MAPSPSQQRGVKKHPRTRRSDVIAAPGPGLSPATLLEPEAAAPLAAAGRSLWLAITHCPVLSSLVWTLETQERYTDILEEEGRTWQIEKLTPSPGIPESAHPSLRKTIPANLGQGERKLRATVHEGGNGSTGAPGGTKG